jgi:hypothetical protein
MIKAVPPPPPCEMVYAPPSVARLKSTVYIVVWELPLKLLNPYIAIPSIKIFAGYVMSGETA